MCERDLNKYSFLRYAQKCKAKHLLLRTALVWCVTSKQVGVSIVSPSRLRITGCWQMRTLFPIKARDVKITNQQNTQTYSFVTPRNVRLTHKNEVLYWLLNVWASFAPSSASITPEVKTC
jgi:hypothetical protein